LTARPRILRVGLTGGIAAGKSTVAGFLRELGAVVIDADAVAHEVTAPGGAAHRAVVERFGPDVVAGDGRLDRTRLGALVFADPDARRALEAIVHPHVRAEAARRFDAAAREGARVGVLDAALLVETGYWRELDRLVVVRCSIETQVRRLAERSGLDAAAARARIAAQAPLAAKLAVADWVVDTDVALDETRRRTAAVYRALLDDLDARTST